MLHNIARCWQCSMKRQQKSVILEKHWYRLHHLADFGRKTTCCQCAQTHPESNSQNQQEIDDEHHDIDGLQGGLASRGEGRWRGRGGPFSRFHSLPAETLVVSSLATLKQSVPAFNSKVPICVCPACEESPRSTSSALRLYKIA